MKEIRGIKKRVLNKVSFCIIFNYLAYASFFSELAVAREYFNPALLSINAPNATMTDLSVFENTSAQAPGSYRVDIILNNELMNTRTVAFSLKDHNDGGKVLVPCLSISELNEYGIKVDDFPGLKSNNNGCADLDAIPNSSTEFRFDRQQLVLSVPQAAITKNPRGYVPPSQWDDGVTAFLLNYSFIGSKKNSNNSYNSESYFMNLRPGLNLGAWRLRNYTTWNYSHANNDHDNPTTQEWNTIYTYAQRNIAPLRALLTLGDGNSPADIFDSTSFRGVQLATDDDMLPESLKGYAPVVRGIARSNAQVIIRQNGYIIYQSYVSPGAFEIKDMYSTGGSGDLNVTIKESDGSEQHLIVPYASLPVLQREGAIKYSLTSAQYRSYNSSVEKNYFSQATGIYGLPWGATIYSGGQFSSPYQSLALGVGKNFGDFGAISIDATQAWSKPKEMEKSTGRSWRIRYSKNLVNTGTNFSIAGYRYSTSGFYTLNEIFDTYQDTSFYPLTERKKNRAELIVNQNLGDGAGSLSLSLINEQYWNTDRRMSSLGLSYSNSWDSISYSLNYSYNRNSIPSSRFSNEHHSEVTRNSGRIYNNDQILSFNVSLPLDRWLSNTYATYSVNSSKKGNTTHTAGLNGTLLEDNNLSWGIQETYGTKGQGNGASMNTDWKAPYGEVTAGYSYDKYGNTLNYGVQGGVLIHEDGITVGQTLGETSILVKAPGARNVGVNNQTGVKTDWRGYALVPNASPYRKNTISLTTETLPDDVDLVLTSQTTVPTRGAVARVNYKANVGQRVLMTLLHNGSIPVPFGATVNVNDGEQAQAAIVGDNGQVYLSGLADKGMLFVKWGNSRDKQCTVRYELSKINSSKQSNVVLTSSDCN